MTQRPHECVRALGTERCMYCRRVLPLPASPTTPIAPARPAPSSSSAAPAPPAGQLISRMLERLEQQQIDRLTRAHGQLNEALQHCSCPTARVAIRNALVELESFGRALNMQHVARRGRSS